MATVNFLYRSTKDKANLHLRLLYRFNDIDFVFGVNTETKVSKDYWSNQHKKSNLIQELKDKQVEINNILNKIENHILQSFNSVNTKIVNKKWLQSQIDNYYKPPQQIESIPNTLTEYIEYYKVARRHDLKPVMIKRCNVIKSKLEKYENDNSAKILIENVNDDFRNSFLDFQYKQKYSLSTIKRELVFIKTICTHAKKKGLKVSLELDDFSKEIKSDNLENANKTFVYLNESDLVKLDNIKPSRLTRSYKDVRDWLVISIYTGQRISDYMRFNASMIRTQNNKKYIEFTQVKTGHKVSIPLHSKILKILENNNNEFPKPISDVKYNEYVKEVCRIAEINEVITGGKISNLGTKENPIWRKKIKEYKKYELVSSHIGRRSFATLNFGRIPTSILKTITSHKTEKMLLNYVGKSENDMLDEISKYFE
jgi:integrase